MVVFQLLINATAAFVFVGLVSIGLSGQFQSLRVISLSVVAAIPTGAYAAKAICTITGTTSMALALVAALMIGTIVALIGAVLDSLLVSDKKVLALLASLGFLKLVQGGITAVTGGAVEVIAVDVPKLFLDGTPFASPPWLPLGLLSLMVAAILQWILLFRTRLGAGAVAVGDQRDLATLFGINAFRIQLVIQGLGGAFAGAAGLLMAVDSGLRPDLGLIVAIKAFGVLIASRNSFVLIFVWAFALVMIEQIVGFYWGGQLREAIGLVFLVAVLLILGPGSRLGHLRAGDE